MAPFDIIESAGKSYRLFWHYRGYLARLAVIPIMIKIVCWNLVIAFGWQEQYVRQAIVMLPSFFADGWMISHFIRLIFLGQTWPFKPTGNIEKDMEKLHSRALGIMRGTVSYVVIKFLMAGLLGLLYMYMQDNMQQIQNAEQDPSLFAFISSMLILAFVLWLFKFTWFYIPAAINHPIQNLYKKIKGFKPALFIAATWMICFIPSLFLYKIFLEAFFGTPAEAPQDFATIQIIQDTCSIIVDTIMLFITTGGIAYAFAQVLLPKEKK